MDNAMDMHSLLAVGTPQVRDEKSIYGRRSYGVRSAKKGESDLNTPKIPGVLNASFLSPKPMDRMESFTINTVASTSNFGSIFEFEGNRPHSLMMQTQMSMDVTAEMSVTTAMLFSEEDPGLHVTESLYQEFLDSYLCYSGEHEVFDLLLSYEGLCSGKVEQLMNITKKAAPTQLKFQKTSKILRILQDERNTWRLLRTLYQDRIETENVDEEEMLMDTMGKRLSDKQLIDNLYLRDSFIRQSQLVVDWLERNAAEDFHYTYFDKLEYFSNQSVSWEHTLHDLRNNGTGLDRYTKADLITELDPDAPIRQKNSSLHDADKEDEARLLKYMFVCLRAGNLDQAQKLAEKFGQPWLAASLEGWRLFHDPNYDNEGLIDGGALLPVEGNKYRDIWKVACWRMSQEPRISTYQQAIYGALSGNLKAILPACFNWEDHLWAYVKVLLDKHTEQELRTNSQAERAFEELPNEYWDKVLDLEQVFQELQACPSDIVKKEGQGYHQVIQRYIILDDIDGLIEQLHSWLQIEPSPSPPHLMRFMAHLILFLRVIGKATKEELCVAMIEAYVKDLIKNRKIPLVAAYAATLPPAHQVIWYAKFLEGITDNPERQQCLQYAEEAGLDVPLITKTVVENMRTKGTETTEMNDALVTTTNEEDKQKIDAIDWLVFDQLQRAEAMKQANALMRVFVATKKLDAAQQVFAKIPQDSIDVMMKHLKLIGQLELSSDDDNATREYLCFKAYLEAFDAFNDWFQHFQHAKPKCPEPLSGNVKFKERVAYEHEVRQYELELERWENCLMAQTRTTTDRLYNVLLFVSGGWMIDQRTDGVIDGSRQKQMCLLRKLCIPQITHLLHNVLHSTCQYKECIQLADIISSERNQLYKEFSIQELRNLLSTLRESSLALLDQNLDPLGYPFQ